MLKFISGQQRSPGSPWRDWTNGRARFHGFHWAKRKQRNYWICGTYIVVFNGLSSAKSYF